LCDLILPNAPLTRYTRAGREFLTQLGGSISKSCDIIEELRREVP
jgi:hypothetical protein